MIIASVIFLVALVQPVVATDVNHLHSHVVALPALSEGDGSDTKDLLDRAIASNPSTAAQWSTLGNRFYEEHRYRDAVASFERSMQLEGAASADAAWNIARSYAQLGNRKQAVRWLTHARELGFTNELAVRREPAFDKYRNEVGEIILTSNTRRSHPSLPSAA
jgi:Tfp pilus assembly protein PilF